VTHVLRYASALGFAAAFALLSLTAGAQGRGFRPVTDEMLRNPPAEDWLSWRGTGQSLGYSPLKQINRDNVGQLQLAWSWTMEAGAQEPAMLAHDGVLYVPNPGGIVQALDGATGNLLWEYRPPTTGPRDLSPLRGISIYDDKIFVALPSAHLVALDARTGKVVWDVAAAKPGFSFRAAPVVTRGGKLVTGLFGCTKFQEEKCGILGHDAKTGKELFRISTIPKPGDPGGETWGDVPYLYRAGTEMWVGGSYDAETNLVYLATSQAKPWTQMARGTDGDALFSNTVFAVNPDTGKVEWYQQIVPGETTDFDEVYENLLVDVAGRKSLFKIGKLLILWEMDRRTGKMLGAHDLGIQNVVDINPTTFKPKYRPDKIPKDQGNGRSQMLDLCPGASAKTWPAMAYAPETQAFYIQHAMTCMLHDYTSVEKVPGGGGVGGGTFTNREHPDAKGKFGRLLALTYDGKTLWDHRQRTVFTTAAMTTGGGLVFIGDFDRYVKAFDVKTGKMLWQSRGTTMASGYPLTYMAQGRQYVAMPFGTGATLAATRVTFQTPPGSLTPEVSTPRPGNVLMVFALPQTPGTQAAR
jgi:alcohol dehydrogenase (cytochrome c)